MNNLFSKNSSIERTVSRKETNGAWIVTETRSWWPPDMIGHSLTLIYRPELSSAELTLGCPASPTFAESTLDGFQAAIADIVAHDRRNSRKPLKYFILSSQSPGIFSMGGDLQTIARLARERNLAEALRFAHKAAEVIYALWTGLGLEIVTTACVSGKAFGAGFEAALACNRIMARRQSTFCLPESRFGLFPAMGATSLLGRRLGQTETDHLISHNIVLTAEQAHASRLVEQVVDDDPVQAELDAVSASGASRWSKLMDVQSSTRRREAFSLDEVMATTTQWAHALASLSPANLSSLLRVANVQSARSKAGRQ